MRSELEQLEQIDQYLGGKMSTEQASAFEAKMEANPQLKSMVEDQQLLIQTVNRNALMAEINAVAGAAGAAGVAGGTAWGLTQWLITIISVATLGVGSVLIYNSVAADEAKDPVAEATEEVELLENSSEDLIMDTSELFSFSMDAENDMLTSDSMEIEMNYAYDEENNEEMVQHESVGTNRQDHIENYEPENIQGGHTETKEDKGGAFTLKSSSGTKKTNLKASFPGGRPALKNFFKKNLHYPRTPYDKGISATVKVTFLVTADGLLENIESDCYVMFDEDGKPLSSMKILANRESKKYFEENAESVFRTSSPWEPATDSEGNPTLSLQTWFVKYKKNGESEVYPTIETEESSTNPCGITSEKDWEKVEIRLMNVKSQPKKFKLKGEGLVKTSKKIKDVDDLTNEQYREICSTAAKFKSCVVFIDVNEFWGEQSKGLYYTFGNFSN